MFWGFARLLFHFWSPTFLFWVVHFLFFASLFFGFCAGALRDTHKFFEIFGMRNLGKFSAVFYFGSPGFYFWPAHFFHIWPAHFLYLGRAFFDLGSAGSPIWAPGMFPYGEVFVKYFFRECEIYEK